jgi:hypothetical protein
LADFGLNCACGGKTKLFFGLVGRGRNEMAQMAQCCIRLYEIMPITLYGIIPVTLYGMIPIRLHTIILQTIYGMIPITL